MTLRDELKQAKKTGLVLPTISYTEIAALNDRGWSLCSERAPDRPFFYFYNTYNRGPLNEKGLPDFVVTGAAHTKYLNRPCNFAPEDKLTEMFRKDLAEIRQAAHTSKMAPSAEPA